MQMFTACSAALGRQGNPFTADLNVKNTKNAFEIHLNFAVF